MRMLQCVEQETHTHRGEIDDLEDIVVDLLIAECEVQRYFQFEVRVHFAHKSGVDQCFVCLDRQINELSFRVVMHVLFNPVSDVGEHEVSHVVELKSKGELRQRRFHLLRTDLAHYLAPVDELGL